MSEPPLRPHRTVQISLDVTTVDEALRLAEIAVRTGVDWLEAGTGLLFLQGPAVIRALRRQFPRHPIVADLKVADGGHFFACRVAEAGATHLDVLAAAHPATLEGAVRAAQEHGLTILGDLMLSSDPVADARRLQALGVHYAMVHLGWEHRQQHPALTALDDLDAVRQAVTIRVQVVGGDGAGRAVTPQTSLHSFSTSSTGGSGSCQSQSTFSQSPSSTVLRKIPSVIGAS
jgi:3-hexulose-6-phosphate synthase